METYKTTKDKYLVDEEKLKGIQILYDFFFVEKKGFIPHPSQISRMLTKLRYRKESNGLNGNRDWDLFFKVSIDIIKNIVDFKNKREGGMDVYYNDVERRRLNILRELREDIISLSIN
tara:strand:- start:21 stop:374 length:354 start_codon:yes stop_codon:yes gene_type:complete